MTVILAAALLAIAPASVAEMKWERRVLIVAAPTARDPAIVEQRRLIAAWRTHADARDLSLVEVIGDQVSGASDQASTLRKAYRLPAGRFAAVLLGKDGGIKRRSDAPLAGAELARTIDSMPMRRAGGR